MLHRTSLWCFALFGADTLCMQASIDEISSSFPGTSKDNLNKSLTALESDYLIYRDRNIYKVM